VQAGNITCKNMNDKVSELLTAIKNAGMAGNTHAVVPASKLKKAILMNLKKEGYIVDFTEEGKTPKQSFSIEIKYKKEKKPYINGVKRVSKLSNRIYRGYRDIMPVKYGYGHMILSTPEGIMTDVEARAKKLGGEALFIIW